MQRIILFLAYLFICCKLTAQQYSFVHYTPREGLVNNRCRFIYQDSKGKLYIATYGGLSIYDGSRFTNLTTENGLADNLINDVIEMGEDSVWIIPMQTRFIAWLKASFGILFRQMDVVPVLIKSVKTTMESITLWQKKDCFVSKIIVSLKCQWIACSMAS